MKSTIQTVLCGALLLFGAAAPAHAQTPATTYPTPTSFEAFRFADRGEEITLARTAAPAAIAKDAEVLVLGPRGYETAVKGHNGFVCLVDRAWSKPFDDPEFWNPKMRAPECWNAVAARSVLPIFLERTRWVMAGTSKTEIARRTAAALAAKKLPRPAPDGMVYMMSRQGYIADGAAPHWHPHVMFYVPLGTADWGANVTGAPVAQADDKAIALSTLFVLVPKWSDGTSALMEMK